MEQTEVRGLQIERGLNALLRYRSCSYFWGGAHGGRPEALRRCYKMMQESTTYSELDIHAIWTRAVMYNLIKQCEYERSREQ